MKNNHTVKLILPFAILGVPGMLGIAAAQSAAQGKLLANGWDSPNASGFRKYAAGFDQWPFDGATIFPTVKLTDGKSISNGYAFSRDKWNPDACRDMIADLQATRSRLKANSFLF